MRDSTSRRRTDSASSVIGATPEAVYGAFADPDALMAWLPPERMTGRVLEYDFREDGRYRIELTYGDQAAPGKAKSTARTDVTITAENVAPGISQADHDAGLRSSLENLARYLA